jgi:hypothetical protein
MAGITNSEIMNWGDPLYFQMWIFFWHLMWKTFCHLDRANSLKTNLWTCIIWIGWSVTWICRHMVLVQTHNCSFSIMGPHILLTKFINTWRMVWNLIWGTSRFYKSKTEEAKRGRKSAIWSILCWRLSVTVVSTHRLTLPIAKILSVKHAWAWV